MALQFNGVVYPVDFIARHTSRGFLPVIVVHLPGGESREVYRGEFLETAQIAVLRAEEVWENGETGCVREFKRDAEAVV